MARDKKIVVVYHGDCPDGFSGAWAAWKKFGNEADYLPARHGEPFPVGLEKKKVFLVDFVPDEVTINMLIANNISVFPIDHHLTSEIKMEFFKDRVFDMDKSGAVLSWEYFHPDKPVPILLQHIQDMDLWQWKLQNSKEIIAYLGVVDFSFNNWDEVSWKLEDEHEKGELIEKGRTLIKYEERIVEGLIRDNAELVEFEGYKSLAVNCPILESDIGNRLVVVLPPMGIVWRRKKNYVTVSLRSDGSVDVSSIAKKHGGGGHRAAAGFEISLNEQLPWKRVGKNQ